MSNNIDQLDIDNPDYESLWSDKCELGYVEILSYPSLSQPVIHRSKGDLNDEDSLDTWLTKDLAIDGKLPESGLRILIGKGWRDVPKKPDAWVFALPFNKSSYSKMSSVLSLPHNLLYIHRTERTRSFKFIAKNSQNEPLTTLVFKLGLVYPSWNLLALIHNHTTRMTTGVFLRHRHSSLVRFVADIHLGSVHPWGFAESYSRFLVENLALKVDDVSFEMDKIEERAAGQSSIPTIETVDPLQIDFLAVTTDISKVGDDLAIYFHRTKSIMMALDVLSELEADRKQIVEELRDQCNHLLLEIEYRKTRKDDLLSVIQQFQAENSARRAISLTEASMDLAKLSKKDSEMMRIIAIDTKRDSKAMKTIAILGMAFLPGTFIASVFAMPVFTWTPDGSMVIQKGFGYYWAVTIPLTLLILGVWGVSMVIPQRNKGVLADEIELESLHPKSNNIHQPPSSQNLAQKATPDSLNPRNSLRHSIAISHPSRRTSRRSRQGSLDSGRVSPLGTQRSLHTSQRASNDSRRSITLNQL